MQRRELLATCLGLCLAGCSSAPAPPKSAPSKLLNQPLTRIGGRTLSGEAIDPATLRGRIVVLKFFAKYCAPCEKTLPGAERLHRENPDVALIGVSEDESRADLDYLIQRHGLTFPIILDRGNLIAGRFRVGELPASIVADRQGKIVWVGGERQSEQDLVAVVDSIE